MIMECVDVPKPPLERVLETTVGLCTSEQRNLGGCIQRNQSDWFLWPRMKYSPYSCLQLLKPDPAFTKSLDSLEGSQVAVVGGADIQNLSEQHQF